jgi:hypothetical protein
MLVEEICMEKDKVYFLTIDSLVYFSPISCEDAKYLGEKTIKDWLWGL